MTYDIEAGRDPYVVPASGKVLVTGAPIEQGDGVAVTKESALEFEALQHTELVVVELV